MGTVCFLSAYLSKIQYIIEVIQGIFLKYNLWYIQFKKVLKSNLLLLFGGIFKSIYHKPCGFRIEEAFWMSSRTLSPAAFFQTPETTMTWMSENLHRQFDLHVRRNTLHLGWEYEGKQTMGPTSAST